MPKVVHIDAARRRLPREKHCARGLPVAVICLHDMHAYAIISCMQYTIRNIPLELDRALKARAKKAGKSVNQVALEALAQSVGQPQKLRTLRRMPGAWSKREAADFDKFLARHRRIDEELWK